MELLFFLGLVVFIAVAVNQGNRIKKIEDALRMGATLPEVTPKDFPGAKDEMYLSDKEYLKNLEKKKDEMPLSQAISQPAVINEPENISAHMDSMLGKDSLKQEKQPAIEYQPEEKAEDKMLEFKLGSKMMTGVGVVALIFGAGYFLKFAFENNLITETMRIVLGVVLGFSLLGLGEFTRKKYGNYSQIVTGGGLGILYLTLYAAYSFYGVFTQAASFSGMVVVTVIGVFLAVRYDSMILAIFAQIGGLLTPLILSSGENHPHILFIYVALLNLGILAIAKWKVWRPLVYLGFFGTALIYFLWFTQHYDVTQWIIAQGYAALFFLIFLGVALSHYFFQRVKPDQGELIMALLNSTFFFIASYLIINGAAHDWRGWVTLLISIFHILLALIIGIGREENKDISRIYMGIGLALLTLFFPIELEKNWITIGWAAEATVLLYLGLRFDSMLVRLFANAAYSLTFFRLIFFDTYLTHYDTPWLNDRVLTYGFCLIFFVLASIFYARKKNIISSEEAQLHSAFMVLSGITFFAGVSTEIWQFFSHHWLTAFWMVLFLGSLVLSLIIRNVAFRAFSFCVFTIATIRLFFFETLLSQGADPYWNVRVLLFSFSILASLTAYIFYKILSENISEEENEGARNFFPSYCYFLAVWVLSAEIIDFHAKYWLPITWSLVALLGGIVSFYIRSMSLRVIAGTTYAVAVFHLISGELLMKVDASYLPVWNSRIASFLITIISAGAFVFVYKYFSQKDGSDNRNLQIIATTFFLVCSGLIFLLLSFELVDYFNYKYFHLTSTEKKVSISSYDNLKNVSLSVGWTIYAISILILGIIRKHALARQLGILVFVVVILKVFLLDTSSLKTFYKFVSFFTLGIILMLVGYLYNRFKESITQFIKAE